MHRGVSRSSFVPLSSTSESGKRTGYLDWELDKEKDSILVCGFAFVLLEFDPYFVYSKVMRSLSHMCCEAERRQAYWPVAETSEHRGTRSQSIGSVSPHCFARSSMNSLGHEDIPEGRVMVAGAKQRHVRLPRYKRALSIITCPFTTTSPYLFLESGLYFLYHEVCCLVLVFTYCRRRRVECSRAQPG